MLKTDFDRKFACEKDYFEAEQKTTTIRTYIGIFENKLMFSTNVF